MPKPIPFLLGNLAPLILLVGVPIALANLRTIVKNQRLAALNRFTDELAATEEDRRYVFQDLLIATDYSSLTADEYRRAERVVNLLNKTGLLIETGVLPPRAVLSLTHTMIIRCWYVLENFVAFHERRIGGRYGRRVSRLAARARRYHDVRPLQRANAITLYRGGNQPPILVYDTPRRRGLARLLQRIGWFIRNVLRRY